jgi:bacillithiol biosynthesis cysteine-adding enzyme BshC
VSGDSETVTSVRIVRDAIDLGRLPWVKSLLAAYVGDFDSVAAFFSGNPASREDWTRTIARVDRADYSRSRVAEIVAADLESRGAPAAAHASAARLAEAGSLAVVTGQQAGLFGGPWYTLLKAITAIQIAREVAAVHGRPAVPVFWVAGEDHDWHEVRETAVLADDLTVARIAAPDVPGAGLMAVSALAFDERIADVLAALERALPPTEFTAGVLAALRRHYRPGSNPGAAMAGWLDDLLGRHGLVVFDGTHAAAKPLVADLFRRELEQPERTAGLVRARGDALRASGHDPQIVPIEHATGLFYLDDAGRHPIRCRDGMLYVGPHARAAGDLRDEALARPERFSPNVMLRSIVQDRLFPTVCYVAGPGELAYQAQLGDVYDAFGVVRPLVAPRASVTMLDSAAARFLDRHQVSLGDLADPGDGVLNRLIERDLPPDVGRAVEDAGRLVDERMGVLKSAATRVDATLAGAVDSTITKMRDALATLQHKLVQAAKRRDETLRRQFERARSLAFPGGLPQERVLGVATFINRYGPGLCDRLLDELPADGRRHYVIVP